jgi:hypothetical protein
MEDFEKLLDKEQKTFVGKNKEIKPYLEKLNKSVKEIDRMVVSGQITQEDKQKYYRFAFNNFRTLIMMDINLQEIKAQKVITLIINVISKEIEKKV